MAVDQQDHRATAAVPNAEPNRADVQMIDPKALEHSASLSASPLKARVRLVGSRGKQASGLELHSRSHWARVANPETLGISHKALAALPLKGKNADPCQCFPSFLPHHNADR
jgi:hypothetical protein